ncbi:MAG: DUF4870 domain-containing protein [Candidatus Woesearchaeota archaeon]
MAKNQGHTVAILSYITLIGWIIALVMHQNEKTSLGSFHLRQTLLLMIIGFGLSIIPVVNLLMLLIGPVLFVFWIIGLVYAIQGKEKEIPLIGGYAQKWFHMI